MRAALVLFIFIGASCGGTATNQVRIMPGRTFVPATIEVPAGTTVQFVNRSDEAHTVTAQEDVLPEGAEYFASGGFSDEESARAGLADGLIAAGETYSVTFEQPGTYRYFCIPHEDQGMAGTVVVT